MASREPAESYRIATQHYWWRPGKALFSALALDAYTRAGAQAEQPVLDLGCGDGTFSSMLEAAGVVERVEFGADYVRRRHPRGRRFAGHMVRADARLLPFRPGALGSVVANGVLSSIAWKEEGEIDLALLEVRRVVRGQGIFLLTVPTPSFTENLCIPPVLRRMKLHTIADEYERQVARRVAHYVVLDEATWRRKLENAGWHVEQVEHFLTPRQARWYGVLRAQPLRAMNLLRVIPLARMRRVVMGLEERLFRAVARTGSAIPDHSARRAGFLLIIARKRHVSVPS